MENSILVTVRLKPDIAERLERLAESIDRSKSYLAAEAIEEYLDIHEWQVEAIKEGIQAIEQEELVDFEEVKQYWEKRGEDSNH